MLLNILHNIAKTVQRSFSFVEYVFIGIRNMVYALTENNKNMERI